MKALTIIQPWATLIASGHKMNETRSWKTNYRGEVLIHAGKNPKDYTSGCYIDDPDGRHLYMEAYMRALNKTHNADLAVQVAMGVTFAVTNTLEAQKPKAEAQPQAQGINPAALLAAMFANAANQQPRDDTGNESDDDE